MQVYEDILEILHHEGIRRLDDLNKVEATGKKWLVDFVTSSRYPWVESIFTRIEQEYSPILGSFKELASPRIVSEKLYSAFTVHDWSVDDEIFSIRAKYCCLFPERLLYLSYQFVYWEYSGVYGIPLDFLCLLLALAPALKEGLAYLLPSRINYVDVDGFSNEVIGTYYFLQKNKHIAIPASGHGYDSLQRILSRQEGHGLEAQLVEIPWLLGARLEDYVELVQENPDEFYLYSSSLGKFVDAQTTTSLETLADWIKDTAAATRQLDVVFKNKRRELTAKGLDVAVGTICTVATLLLPETMALVKPALTTLFGTKTVYEGIRWIHEYNQAKDLLSAEKDWLLWRIKK